METRLVVSFIESAQGPDHINRFVRGEFLISGIGCTKIEIGQCIYTLDQRDVHATTALLT